MSAPTVAGIREIHMQTQYNRAYFRLKVPPIEKTTIGLAYLT